MDIVLFCLVLRLVSFILFCFLSLSSFLFFFFFFFFNDTATTEIYTLSLHDALPIWRNTGELRPRGERGNPQRLQGAALTRSEEHTSELQSRGHLVCRLLLEKKKKKNNMKKRKRKQQNT